MDVMRKEKDHNEIHQNTERWFKFNAYLSVLYCVAFTPVDKAYSNTEGYVLGCGGYHDSSPYKHDTSSPEGCTTSRQHEITM